MLETIVVDLDTREEMMIVGHAATEMTQDPPVRDEADATLLREDEIRPPETEGPETTPDQDPLPDGEILL